MKLCIVGNVDVPAKWIGDQLARCKPSFAKVLRPETEVALKPAKGGLRGETIPDTVRFCDNPYFVSLGHRAIVEAFIEAEREGFDAAWVNCFDDPGVREARFVVRIPVLGPAESTLHFACQLGRKMAIICASQPGSIAKVEEQVKLHGLESRLIPNGIRMDKEPLANTLEKWVRNPQMAADSVAELARQCVADGADVIVIGCMGIGPLCSMVGFNKLTIDGQEVPILDPGMVVAKMAEMAVDIKKATGLPIPSRVRNYVLPAAEDWRKVRSLFGLPT